MTDETLMGIATIIGAVFCVQGLFTYGIVKLVVTGRPLLKWHAETWTSTSETKDERSARVLHLP